MCQPCASTFHPRVEEVVDVRVLDDVRRRVGRRKRDRDDEAGRREPEQREDEELALPAREQVLKHRDRAVAVRAGLGHALVHRQRAEEREQDEDERRYRRERPGGEGGDAGLVAERREVVHARQAHHLPPGVRVVLPLALVRPLDLFDLPLKQPALEPAGLFLLLVRDDRFDHLASPIRGQDSMPGRVPDPTAPIQLFENATRWKGRTVVQRPQSAPMYLLNTAC